MRALKAGYDLALASDLLLTIRNVAFGQFQVTRAPSPYPLQTEARYLSS